MRLLLIVVGALALDMGAAGAQTVNSASRALSAEAASVVRGLEAQHQAALIRERRMADDREARFIADAETRLSQARAQADRRVAGAEAELTSARAAYAELVNGIALRDASARAEIEAYRAEALGLAERASPELLAAYQRFADGDRVGAWPIIEALSQAQVRATVAAANARAAAVVRDMARARETMRWRGEARAADVLPLWDQAAALDPSDSRTHVARAQLLLAMGRLDAAHAAALLTRANSRGDVERHRAAAVLFIWSERQNDPVALYAAEVEEGVARSRAYPCGGGLVGFLSCTAGLMARLAVNVGALTRGDEPFAADDRQRTRADLEAALALHNADIASARAQFPQTDLASALEQAGDVRWALGDVGGALGLWREALQISRASAGDRSSDRSRREAAKLLAKLARAGDTLSWAQAVSELEAVRTPSAADVAALSAFRARASN